MEVDEILSYVGTINSEHIFGCAAGTLMVVGVHTSSKGKWVHILVGKKGFNWVYIHPASWWRRLLRIRPKKQYVKVYEEKDFHSLSYSEWKIVFVPTPRRKSLWFTK